MRSVWSRAGFGLGALLALSACGGASSSEPPGREGEDPETRGDAGPEDAGDRDSGGAAGMDGETGGPGTPAAGGEADGGGSGGGGPGEPMATGGASGSGSIDDTLSLPNCEAAQEFRLVRLTRKQLINSVENLLGSELAEALRQGHEVGVRPRAFPPLNDASEGQVIGTEQWAFADAVARQASEYLAAQFATLSQCETAPTTECATAFLLDFARRAYRRPLTGDDEATLLGVYETVLSLDGTTEQAIQHTAWAILESPFFLYRPELGLGASDLSSGPSGRLSDYEIASALSFFLTDYPPDDELMTAAAEGDLEDPYVAKEHIERLLETAAVHDNLEQALLEYFGAQRVDTVNISPELYDLNSEVRNQIKSEARFFMEAHLWSAPLSQLLTSRRTRVNIFLAELYGVDFPASAADETGFADVELPEERSGILTQSAFLTAYARFDETSVMTRGLAVRRTLLCRQPIPFPEALAVEVDEFVEVNSDANEIQRAELRAAQEPCATCHTLMDPYGVALERFDLVGAYRSTYPDGSAIDIDVALPNPAVRVQSARELGEALAADDGFTECMATRFLEYMQASPNCSGNAIIESLPGDPGFSQVIRQIALAIAFSGRTASAAQ